MIAKKKQAKPAPDQTQPFYLKKNNVLISYLLMTLASKTNPLLSIKGKERIKKLTLKK